MKKANCCLIFQIITYDQVELLGWLLSAISTYKGHYVEMLLIFRQIDVRMSMTSTC